MTFSLRYNIRYGTNDYGFGTNLTTFQADYLTMLANIRMGLPEAKIYVEEIFPRTGNPSAYNAEIATDFSTFADSNSQFIPTAAGWFDPATETLSNDGLHPIAEAFAKIANRELPAVAGYTLHAPVSGQPLSASGNGTITIASGATFTGDQTITITSSNGSDIITTSVGSPGTGAVTVTPTNGSTNFTFTMDRSTPGTSTLTFTNGQGWTDPSNVTYTATDSDSSSSSTSSASSDSSSSPSTASSNSSSSFSSRSSQSSLSSASSASSDPSSHSSLSSASSASSDSSSHSSGSSASSGSSNSSSLSTQSSHSSASSDSSGSSFDLYVAPSRVLTGEEYLSISQQYAQARMNQLYAIDDFYETVNIIARLNQIQPTLDLLQPFYQAYLQANAKLGSTSTFETPVRTLQSHVLAYGGESMVAGYIEKYIVGNGLAAGIPEEWAVLSKTVGVNIDSVIDPATIVSSSTSSDL